MSGYSKELTATVTGGETTCVELPASMRGQLTRFVCKQSTGTAVNFAFKIYDRKGAVTTANDLNTLNGNVLSVTNSSSKALVTVEEAHNLHVGDTIEIKGSNVSAYNTTHTVFHVVDATSFVTTVSYTSAGTGGKWQTSPLLPTVDPVAHELLSASVTSGNAYNQNTLNINYENRDNQSLTARRRHSGLWLALTPEGTGEKVFTIAITTEADALF